MPGKLDKKPTILHINTEKGFRGGEVQTLEIARRLHDLGYPTILLAFKGGPLAQKAGKMHIETVEFSPRGELDIFSAIKIKKIVLERGVRLVHCHTSQSLGLVYLSGIYKKGIKVVATRRVSFPLKSKLSLKKYLIASKIIAVAEEVGLELVREGVSSEKIVVIHSGIDLERFQNLPEPDIVKERLGVKSHFPVIGVVGALAHHKGHQTFLKALNLVWAKFPALIAIFVGDGPAADDLKKSVVARALPCLFVGHIENVAPIYRAFDIFVLPSISGEGSPGVVKEAAASLVPILATSVGGIQEILRHNQEALIVPPSDYKKMAEAIIFLAGNESTRKSLAKAAKERARHFSFDKVIEEHDKLYSSLFRPDSKS